MKSQWTVERKDVAGGDWKKVSTHKSEVLACRRLLREYRQMKRECGGDAWNAEWRVRNTKTDFIRNSIDARFIGIIA